MAIRKLSPNFHLAERRYTLTLTEQERLKKMYDAAEGEDKKILKRILRKYGAYKLEL